MNTPEDFRVKPSTGDIIPEIVIFLYLSSIIKKNYPIFSWNESLKNCIILIILTGKRYDTLFYLGVTGFFISTVMIVQVYR